MQKKGRERERRTDGETFYFSFPLQGTTSCSSSSWKTHLDCHPKTQFIGGMWVRPFSRFQHPAPLLSSLFYSSAADAAWLLDFCIFFVCFLSIHIDINKIHDAKKGIKKDKHTEWKDQKAIYEKKHEEGELLVSLSLSNKNSIKLQALQKNIKLYCWIWWMERGAFLLLYVWEKLCLSTWNKSIRN